MWKKVKFKHKYDVVLAWNLAEKKTEEILKGHKILYK